MANLMDLLLGNNAVANQAAISQNTGAAIPAATQLADGSTEVSPVTVTPSKRQSAPVAAPQQSASIPPVQLTTPPALQTVSQAPTPATLDYNNSNAVQALQKAQQATPPQGGSDNPGIYGVLPQNLQHGTLRNVLGALGDAFLVGSGHQATYAPRMQRQEIGNAMAGYDPNDPNAAQAAIQRVAATGAPGAAEMADKMQTQYEQAQMRKQYMDYNNSYRQQMIDSRNDQALQRMTPFVGGLVSGAKNQDDYTSVYQRADQIAKRIGPQYSAQDFGLVDPSQWSPNATANVGMTANNVQTSQDKNAQRQVSMRDTDVNAGSRITAANIGANSHVQSAQIGANKPTSGTLISNLIIKQNSGQPLTPAEQTVWAHYTQTKGSGRRSLPAGLTVGGGAPQPTQQGGGSGGSGIPPSINPSTLPVLTVDQARRLSQNHPGQTIYFKGTDGLIHHN